MRKLFKMEKNQIINTLKTVIRLVKVSKSGEYNFNLERPVEKFDFTDKELKSIIKSGIIYNTIIDMNLKLSNK